MGVNTPATSTSHAIKDYVITILVAGITFPVPSVGNDSEAFTYKRNKEETNILKVDLAGNGHWGQDPDHSGELEFTFFHTNTANALFQTRLGDVGAGIFSLKTGTFDILIKDNEGKIFLRANKCKVKGQPSGNRAKDPTEIKWTVTAIELYPNEVGLNPDT